MRCPWGWVSGAKVERVKGLQLSSSHPAQNAEASEKQLSGVKIYIRVPPGQIRESNQEAVQKERNKNLKITCESCQS